MHGGDLHDVAGARRVDHLAVADVDTAVVIVAADVARLQIPRCDQTTRTFVNRNDFRMRLQMRLRASAPLESVVVPCASSTSDE